LTGASFAAGHPYLLQSQPHWENRAMSNANVSLVQSLYAAFGRGEIPTIIAAMAPDVDWSLIGRQDDHPLFGARSGSSQVQEFFKMLAELQESVSFTPKEFYASDDRVFVLGHYNWKIRKTGRHAESDWCHIFTVKNGKITKFLEFTDTAQFAEAVRA
jgi:hypothetical protein